MLESTKPTIEDIERKVLSSVRKRDDLIYLARADISFKDFEVYPDIAEFVLTYPKKFNKFPTDQGILTQFPNFNYSPIDDVKYLLETFRKEILAKRIRSVLHTTTTSYLKLDPDEAASYLLKNSKQFVFSSVTNNRSVTDGDTDLRLDTYLTRKEELKTLGFASISSPWQDAMYYWLPGMVGVIWGMWSAGKSFFTMDLAIRTAYLKGRKTVYVSPEMMKYEIEARFDSLLGHYKGYEFNSASLIMGKDINEEAYKEYLTLIKDTSLWVTYENEKDPFTVTALEGIIETENPYLLVIDGVNLLKDENKGYLQHWEHMSNLIRDIKNLATTKGVTILCVAQENEEGKMADSKAIARFADKLIHIATYPHRTKAGGKIKGKKREDSGEVFEALGEDDPDSNIRHITVTKNRSTGKEIPKSVPIVFNPNLGMIGDLVDDHDEGFIKEVDDNHDGFFGDKWKTVQYGSPPSEDMVFSKD